MRNILAIIERELRAYFISPIAYVVLTIFVFLSGLFFRSILAQVLQMGLMSQIQAQQMGPRPMDMPGMITRGFLSTMSVILLFIMPMLTMGLFSEEKNFTRDGFAGGARKVSCSRCVLPDPAADDLDTDGHPVPLQQSGVRTDPDGISRFVALRSRPGGDRALHFDSDGESNHRGRVEFRYHHGALARGRLCEQCGFGEQQSRFVLSFDTESSR